MIPEDMQGKKGRISPTCEGEKGLSDKNLKKVLTGKLGGKKGEYTYWEKGTAT